MLSLFKGHPGPAPGPSRAVPGRIGEFPVTSLEHFLSRCFHSIHNELWALFFEILVPF